MILIDRRAILDILAQRVWQDETWGEQYHDPLYWLGILTEELGGFAKCCIEPDTDSSQYRRELVQLAAVAVAAIESMDRAMTSAATSR